MTIIPDDLLKLVLALLVGGLIGIERELHHKTAGFRTIILICTGATLFTMFSLKIDGTGRVAANIVSGVGFIGAGVILHDATRITGLTTASTVWLSAALGMGIGSGEYVLMVTAAMLVLVVLCSSLTSSGGWNVLARYAVMRLRVSPAKINLSGSRRWFVNAACVSIRASASSGAKTWSAPGRCMVDWRTMIISPRNSSPIQM